MTRDGAVDTGTPKDETVATPPTPAKTPQDPPPTPAKTPQDPDPTVDTNTGMTVTERVGPADSPRVGNNSVVESTKKNSKLNPHGEPVKEQERVSYQNMIVRYGDWSNIRGQVLAYFFLIIITGLYRGYSFEAEAIGMVTRVSNGSHIHCCCSESAQQRKLTNIWKQFELNDSTKKIIFVVMILMGGPSLMWERFVGRRRLFFAYLAAAVPGSVAFMFENVSTIRQISHVILSVCSLMTLLITASNLAEMLPYETRYLAVYSHVFAQSVSSAIATIHYHFGFSISDMGITFAIAYVLGILILRFFIKDSICHLNIRNEVQAIEQIVQKEEYRLHVKKREGNRLYHQAIAKKIFEDLVYLDQDELKLSDFFNRIYKNPAMIDIVLGFFQSISAGICDYEFTRFTNERFYSSSELAMDRMLGMAVAAILMHFLRKAHRNRVICWLVAAALINSIARHAIIKYEVRNNCAEIQFVTDEFTVFSRVLSVFATTLGHCFEMTILLHFLETAPSILRSTCVLLVYLPWRLAKESGSKIFIDSVSKDLTVLLPVYSYHLLIIILTMLRTRSRLPFSLYLFDLMPQADNENGDDNKQQPAQMIEETALPGNFSTETEKTEIKDQNKEEKKEEVMKKPKNF